VLATRWFSYSWIFLDHETDRYGLRTDVGQTPNRCITLSAVNACNLCVRSDYLEIEHTCTIFTINLPYIVTLGGAYDGGRTLPVGL